MKRKISLSQEFDEGKWSWDDIPYGSNRRDNKDYNISFEDAIDRMKDNFDARVKWMDDRINGKNGQTALGRTNPTFKYNDPSKWPAEE